MAIQKKRGALSTKEQITITSLLERGISVEDIATQLNRHKKPILRFINQKSIRVDDIPREEQDYARIRAALHNKPFWKGLQNQFSKDELNTYTSLWTTLVLQFDEDVKASEELQIKSICTTEIILGRILSNGQQCILEKDRLKKLIEEEYNKSQNIRDINVINNLETQLAYCKTQEGSYTIEYGKMLDKKNEILRGLKATREARIKKIEDSRSKFTDYLRILENEDKRAEEGRQIEIERMAAENAKKKLSEYHTYMDGNIDQPFLCADTVKD